MMTVTIVEGRFKKELPNRFRAQVLVRGRAISCYIPTTTKLISLVPMQNRRVRLIRNNKGLVLDSLFYRNAWVGLNSATANKIWFDHLARTSSRPEQLMVERMLEGYKFDVLDKWTNTAYEVKSIISIKKEIDYPCVHSEHMCDQLNRLQEICGRVNVSFVLIALSPFVRSVRILRRSQFGRRLEDLLLSGGTVAAYRIYGSVKRRRLASIEVKFSDD